MSDLFDRVRDLYGFATGWNANDEVPAHIQKLRAQNLNEFDRMIKQVKEDVWDEGFQVGDGVGTYSRSERDKFNPYRKQEEA